MSTISASTTSTTAFKVTADTTGTLVLQTGASPTTAVTIDTSQNVGIGTSAPNGYSGFGALTMNGTSGGLVDFSVGGSRRFSVYGNSAGGILETVGAYPLIFTTNGSERARITSAGDFLVGATAIGNKGLSNIVDPNGIYSLWNVSSTGFNALQFRQNGTSAGSVTINATTVSYNTLSDYRLKENITPMTGALSVVQQLKPCTYSWKSDGSEGQGFIAHELQAVVPDCVTGEKDAVDADGNPVYQGIDTSFLVATLTAAIQELKAELDAAKADIATLKGTA